jgi:translation elongation factor EF-Tu-like GTPase
MGKARFQRTRALRFAIRDGGRTVGAGVVAKILK